MHMFLLIRDTTDAVPDLTTAPMPCNPWGNCLAMRAIAMASAFARTLYILPGWWIAQ